jgi:hypothetical protein
MQNPDKSVPTAPTRTAWNKGKLIGAKPPLRPKHVWSIRTKLQVSRSPLDLATPAPRPATSCIAHVMRAPLGMRSYSTRYR